MSDMISWLWFIYNESSLVSHIEFGLPYSTTLTTFLFLFSHWINPISAFWLVDLISAYALEQISSTLFQFTCDSFPRVIRMTHWWIIRWLTSVTTVTCSGALNHIWIKMLLSYALWCYLNEQNCPKKDWFLQDKPCLASKSWIWAGQTCHILGLGLGRT